MVIQFNTQNMNRAVSKSGNLADISGNRESSLKSGSMFAGNTNLPSMIDQKRDSARKQAMKIVSDAFSGERKLDATMQGIRDKVSALKEENYGYTKEIQANEERISELADMYGIDPESEEQKDLELLHKRSMAENKLETEPFTKEEMERLAELDKQGLTEYQERALEIYKMNDTMQHSINDNNALIEGNNAAIENMKIERLKTNPIGEAMDAAEDIMDAASDEIKSMIVKDSMQHIEEKAEEEKEKAEERAEQKEEEEEKLEAAKERKEELDELVEKAKENNEEVWPESERAKKASKNIIENASDMAQLSEQATASVPQDQVNTEIQNILNKLSLLPEDIKGVKVDDLL
ncbi:MAG TPA: hypothetical protein DCL38_04085 [Lachnospiraceae bacterium]|nr:hypothetical protein [Lachnospiraceae bacterium]